MFTTLKRVALIAAGLLFANAAWAQACPCDSAATRITGASALASLLDNKMVCVGTPGNWQNQEFHSGGTVSDYKLGSDLKDPSTAVGSYTISGNNVTYTYTAGGSYTFSICQESTSPARYAFCSGATKAVSGARIGGSALASCATIP